MSLANFHVLYFGVSALLEAARKINFGDNLSQIASGFASGRYKFAGSLSRFQFFFRIVRHMLSQPHIEETNTCPEKYV